MKKTTILLAISALFANIIFAQTTVRDTTFQAGTNNIISITETQGKTKAERWFNTKTKQPIAQLLYTNEVLQSAKTQFVSGMRKEIFDIKHNTYTLFYKSGQAQLTAAIEKGDTTVLVTKYYTSGVKWEENRFYCANFLKNKRNNQGEKQQKQPVLLCVSSQTNRLHDMPFFDILIDKNIETTIFRPNGQPYYQFFEETDKLILWDEQGKLAQWQDYKKTDKLYNINHIATFKNIYFKNNHFCITTPIVTYHENGKIARKIVYEYENKHILDSIFYNNGKIKYLSIAFFDEMALLVRKTKQFSGKSHLDIATFGTHTIVKEWDERGRRLASKNNFFWAKTYDKQGLVIEYKLADGTQWSRKTCPPTPEPRLETQYDAAGELTGECRLYHTETAGAPEVLRIKANFKAGVPDGLTEMYSADGDTIFSAVYENGAVIKDNLARFAKATELPVEKYADIVFPCPKNSFLVGSTSAQPFYKIKKAYQTAGDSTVFEVDIVDEKQRLLGVFTAKSDERDPKKVFENRHNYTIDSVATLFYENGTVKASINHRTNETVFYNEKPYFPATQTKWNAAKTQCTTTIFYTNGNKMEGNTNVYEKPKQYRWTLNCDNKANNTNFTLLTQEHGRTTMYTALHTTYYPNGKTMATWQANEFNDHIVRSFFNEDGTLDDSKNDNIRETERVGLFKTFHTNTKLETIAEYDTAHHLISYQKFDIEGKIAIDKQQDTIFYYTAGRLHKKTNVFNPNDPNNIRSFQTTINQQPFYCFSYNKNGSLHSFGGVENGRKVSKQWHDNGKLFSISIDYDSLTTIQTFDTLGRKARIYDYARTYIDNETPYFESEQAGKSIYPFLNFENEKLIEQGSSGATDGGLYQKGCININTTYYPSGRIQKDYVNIGGREYEHDFRDTPDGAACYGEELAPVYTGKMKNGVRDGLWQARTQDGKMIYELNYADSLLHGEVRLYDTLTQTLMASGLMERGRPVGVWRTRTEYDSTALYFDKGVVLRREIFDKKGKLAEMQYKKDSVIKISFFQNKKTMREIFTKNNAHIDTKYYLNGKIREQMLYDTLANYTIQQQLDTAGRIAERFRLYKNIKLVQPNTINTDENTNFKKALQYEDGYKELLKVLSENNLDSATNKAQWQLEVQKLKQRIAKQISKKEVKAATATPEIAQKYTKNWQKRFENLQLPADIHRKMSYISLFTNNNSGSEASFYKYFNGVGLAEAMAKAENPAPVKHNNSTAISSWNVDAFALSDALGKTITVRNTILDVVKIDDDQDYIEVAEKCDAMKEDFKRRYYREEVESARFTSSFNGALSECTIGSSSDKYLGYCALDCFEPTITLDFCNSFLHYYDLNTKKILPENAAPQLELFAKEMSITAANAKQPFVLTANIQKPNATIPVAIAHTGMVFIPTTFDITNDKSRLSPFYGKPVYNKFNRNYTILPRDSTKSFENICVAASGDVFLPFSRKAYTIQNLYATNSEICGVFLVETSTEMEIIKAFLLKQGFEVLFDEQIRQKYFITNMYDNLKEAYTLAFRLSAKYSR